MTTRRQGNKLKRTHKHSSHILLCTADVLACWQPVQGNPEQNTGICGNRRNHKLRSHIALRTIKQHCPLVIQDICRLGLIESRDLVDWYGKTEYTVIVSFEGHNNRIRPKYPPWSCLSWVKLYVVWISVSRRRCDRRYYRKSETKSMFWPLSPLFSHINVQ
jgi:hypothetical protein